MFAMESDALMRTIEHYLSIFSTQHSMSLLLLPFLFLNAIYFKYSKEVLQHLLMLTSSDLFRPAPPALWKNSNCKIANKNVIKSLREAK